MMQYEKELKELVEKQAEDEGIFFAAQTGPEAYLQQEIRKLHALIEENEMDIMIWCEDVCGDPDCGFCKDRPENPVN